MKKDTEKVKLNKNVLIFNPYVTDENVKEKTAEGLVYKTKLYPLTNPEKFVNRTMKKAGNFSFKYLNFFTALKIFRQFTMPFFCDIFNLIFVKFIEMQHSLFLNILT